ncbi:hypothetical protein ABEB36_011706 [Hypothenemus hampei]|uniref:WD repeat-containing protein 63 n=1 Tax=Hypothenemus hampei TaxID=57062 RepID=A0ABD1E905_HYPHA
MQTMGSEVEVDESIVKNNRPLLEVEVETKYPIFSHRIQFRLLPVESKRDGYMELRCDEYLASIVMKRIDNALQVAPVLRSTEAQTICPYPRNATTQYLYEIPETETSELLAECRQEIVKYANEHLEDFGDMLRVNGAINLYSNDFAILMRNAHILESAYWSETSKQLVEYLSFMDVNLCKGKMISDIYWHRMWSGIIAIAYCDSSPHIFYSGPNKDDEVYKAVHSTNLVLIWSFLDVLKPKLILESPREVHKISFCKFDENILVGGCENGQIIVWDLRNKLQKVEKQEILTTAQQKYRSFLNSLMGWMKDTHDISIIRPTALSDLRYSHKSTVTGISWLEPHYEFTRMGNLSIIEPNEDGIQHYSLQCISTALDGTILIWDLKDKPIVHPGGYKPKKLKRLKKKPSALQVDESPYRVLHLNLKPRYKINIFKRDDKNKSVAITHSTTAYCWLKYEEVFPDLNKKFDIRERIIYKPIMTERRDIEPRIKIGTSEGDFAEIQWEGQDFDSGEIVNSETGKYVFDAKYHDGPVNSIFTSPIDNTVLTVGGKIFAIWSNKFPNRPILWRRNRQFYTKGELHLLNPFKILVYTVTGVLSRWILSINSKAPVYSQVMSNGFLTASGTQPNAREKNVYGIGDEQGAFHLFYIKQSSISYTETMNKAMANYMKREIVRKTLFLKWQDEFNKRNENYLQRKKEEEKLKAKEEAEKETAKQEQKQSEETIKKGPQPGRYIAWIVEQRQAKEEARIKAMIINKKQLDTKELEKRRKPLQKLDEENERKKSKQKERLKQADTIFKDTVASLFPEVVKEKPSPPLNPYTGGNTEEDKENCYVEYQEIEEEMDEFIALNPLQYDFNFKSLLVANRAKMDEGGLHSHLHARRYDLEKQLRIGHESVKKINEEDEEEEIERID